MSRLREQWEGVHVSPDTKLPLTKWPKRRARRGKRARFWWGLCSPKIGDGLIREAPTSKSPCILGHCKGQFSIIVFYLLWELRTPTGYWNLNSRQRLASVHHSVSMLLWWRNTSSSWSWLRLVGYVPLVQRFINPKILLVHATTFLVSPRIWSDSIF